MYMQSKGKQGEDESSQQRSDIHDPFSYLLVTIPNTDPNYWKKNFFHSRQHCPFFKEWSFHIILIQDFTWCPTSVSSHLFLSHSAFLLIWYKFSPPNRIPYVFNKKNSLVYLKTNISDQ